MLNRNNGAIHGLPGPARTKKIFVGGLASTVTENDFREYFGQFGAIIDVVVMYDHNTQRPRGFGFITYDSEEAVEKVLHKTFHELNGKMVEVKRAVPKEISPGPSRSPIVGYNYSPNRPSNLLNEHTIGYKQSLAGGYGSRMDNRFSPAGGVRNGLPPVGPGHMTGLNFDSGLTPGYMVGANFNSNIGSGRGWSPFYGGNSNSLGSPVRFGGSAGGGSSVLSSPGQNLWGDGSISFSSDSSISSALTSCLNANSGVGSFGDIEAIWGASKTSGSDARIGSGFINGSLGFGSGNSIIGQGRNNRNNTTQLPSYSAPGSGYNRAYADPQEGISTSDDPNRLLLPSELDEAFLFGYGLGNTTSDIMTKTASGYGVISRQTNRGMLISFSPMLKFHMSPFWSHLVDFLFP